jgi:zinc/manganese transport system substrate-binding protein
MRMTFSMLAASMRRLVWLPLALLLAVAGCGDEHTGTITVVATTTQAADLTRNVAGSTAHVVQLLAPNADPHEYEVRPSDLKALADADLIVRSGGDVDEWLDDAIEGSGTDAPVVTLSDKIKLNGDDPHWWQDPRNAVTAIAEIETGLDRVDPAHKTARARTTAAYRKRLRRLDRDVAACVEKLPQDYRKLVTTHDALGYYARRYGFDVIGTVIPSLSTEGQPSAGDTAKLITTIRRTGVKAIFAESSVNSKVEAAIASETGARVGKALWADSLGPEGSDGATYVDSIWSNTVAIVEGLTRGKETC